MFHRNARRLVRDASARLHWGAEQQPRCDARASCRMWAPVPSTGSAHMAQLNKAFVDSIPDTQVGGRQITPSIVQHN